MNTRFYETFIVLSKTGNFSRTAEQMNATQPAINGRISALEDHLGVKLYEKGKKPFQLTPHGKVVLEYAKNIVRMEDELKATFSKTDSGATIKIGAIEIVTIAWLPLFIRQLRDECPGVNIEFTTGTVAELLPQLKNEELDIAFVVGSSPGYGMHTENICSFAMWWIANPLYYKTDQPIDVHELSKYRIVMASPKTSIFPYIKEYFALHDMEEVFFDTQDLKIDCVASVPTALSIVKSGLGIMPAPAALVLREVDSGELARLPVRQELPNAHVSACFKVRNGSPLIDHIIRIARECAAGYAKTVKHGLVWV